MFAKNLIGTLRQRELGNLGKQLAAETGQPFNPSAAGEYVAGTYRQRFALASGRFAMLDDGLGFQLVPWTPSLDKQLGRYISGVARADGGIDWGFGRTAGSVCERSRQSPTSGKDGRHVRNQDSMGAGHHGFCDRPSDDLGCDGMDGLAARLPTAARAALVRAAPFSVLSPARLFLVVVCLRRLCTLNLHRGRLHRGIRRHHRGGRRDWHVGLAPTSNAWLVFSQWFRFSRLPSGSTRMSAMFWTSRTSHSPRRTSSSGL